MKMSTLIKKAVVAKSKQLLKKSNKKTSRVIDDSDIVHISNIDIENKVGSMRKIPKVKSLKSGKHPRRKKTRIKNSS